MGMTPDRFEIHIRARPLRLVMQKQGMRESRLVEASLSKEDGCRELVADIDDFKLGMVLDGEPPGCLLVVRTKPGSWAERLGIYSGSCVVSSNGEELSQMSAEVWKLHLDRRPVRLRVLPAEEVLRLVQNCAEQL